MTVKQKLELFAEKIETGVERQRYEAALENAAIVKAAVQEAEAEARREMADILNAERHRLESEANRKIYAVTMDVRTELSALRERLAGQLFFDLEKDLGNEADPALLARFKELKDDWIDIWHKRPDTDGN